MPTPAQILKEKIDQKTQSSPHELPLLRLQLHTQIKRKGTNYKQTNKLFDGSYFLVKKTKVTMKGPLQLQNLIPTKAIATTINEESTIIATREVEKKNVVII